MTASETLTALICKPELKMLGSYIIIGSESANASKDCTIQVARAYPVNPEALAISHPSDGRSLGA